MKVSPKEAGVTIKPSSAPRSVRSLSAAIDAKENEAWTASEAGKDFIRDSARQWGNVHMQSGEDKQIALDMAEMTAKFYTGE